MQTQTKMMVSFNKQDLIKIAIEKANPNFEVDDFFSFIEGNDSNLDDINIHLIKTPA